MFAVTVARKGIRFPFPLSICRFSNIGDEFRTEKDSLGSIRINAKVKWGAQTQRAVDNFDVSSWRMPPSFLKQLALLKSCIADVNGEMNYIDSSISEHISQVAMNLHRKGNWSDFPVDVFQTGSGTSTNMNMNEVIAALVKEEFKIPIHPNDHVNCNQSSNDVVPTAICMAVTSDGYRTLLPALEELIQCCKRRAGEFKDIVKSGRTHLMDATPLTMEQELLTWADQLQFSCDAIENALFNCLELPIGGRTVGNSFMIFDELVVAKLCESSGIPYQVAKNKAVRMASQDHIVMLSGALRALSTCIYKISNDLRWLNSGPMTGLGEIVLPCVQPGSSIMPGKINPVICESAMMSAVHVIGSDTIIAMSGQSANFQLHVMLPLVAYHIIDNIHILSHTCQNLSSKAISGFSVNYKRIEEMLSKNAMLVTNLTPVIGYDQCAKIVQTATKENRPILSVAKEMTNIDIETLRQLLDPKTMICPRPPPAKT